MITEVFKLFARHHHHNDSPWAEAPPWAIELREMLGLILNRERNIMTVQTDIAAALAQLTTDVTAQTTATAGFVTYIQGLQAQLATITAQTTDTTTAAALTALDSQITANTTADAAAIVVNTPAPVSGAPPVTPAVAAASAQAAVKAAA
jgi:hypothetical protein